MTIPPIDDFGPSDLENQIEMARTMAFQVTPSVSRPETLQGIEILQSTFSRLPGCKKTLPVLVGGTGGVVLLGVGLSKGDIALIGTGTSLLGVSFLSALAFITSEQAHVQSKDQVITKLHTLVRTYSHIGEDQVFEEELKDICSIYIEEVPVNARNPENNKILLTRLTNASWRFFQSLSSLEQKEERNIASIEIILANIVTDFCCHAREVKERVQKDKFTIQRTFFSDREVGEFTLKMASGETHHQGKGVVFVTFNEDETLQVVYKPRDLRIDALIVGSVSHNPSLYALTNELIHTAENPQPFHLPTYKFLHEEEGVTRYGYAEFLSHGLDDCTLNVEEMKEYYQIMGGIQFLAQIFGITDLHRENILVHAKKPYPIDLEVTFDVQSMRQNNSCSTGLQEAINAYGSVVACKDTNIINVSTPNRVRLCENDEIQEIEKHYAENYKTYIEQIEIGFNVVKNLMENNKGRLEGFINQIPHDIKIRFLPTNTADLLALMRGSPFEVIDNLCRMLNDEYPALVYKIHSEVRDPQVKEDVMHWDIPRMTTDIYGAVHYNGLHFLDCRDDLSCMNISMEEKGEEIKMDSIVSFSRRQELVQSLVESREEKIKTILVNYLEGIRSLQLDENFKKSLCKFSLYGDLVFNQKQSEEV